MGGGEVRGFVAFSVGGKASDPASAIPRGNALLSECGRGFVDRASGLVGGDNNVAGRTAGEQEGEKERQKRFHSADS